MTTQALSHACQMIERHEGMADHLYLCPAGVVTCGVGHALFSVHDATEIPFLDQKGDPATTQDIMRDYSAVNRVRGVHEARFYRALTQTRLAQHVIDDILERDVWKFARICGQEIPHFDELPEGAQVALLDIAFNCGSLTKWPKLKAAVIARDWAAASRESYRPQVSAARNQDTKALFAQAAAQHATDQFKAL